MKTQKWLLLAGCLFLLCACGTTTEIDEGGGLFVYFRAAYPDNEIVATLEGDFNADGITDLALVYREAPDKYHLITVYSRGNGFGLTRPIPAPSAGVTLDGQEQHGFYQLIMSGRQGIHLSFSVMHFVDGEWVNLLGEVPFCC